MTWTIRHTKLKKFVNCNSADYNDGQGYIVRYFDTTLHGVRSSMTVFNTELDAQVTLNGLDKYFDNLSSPAEKAKTWYKEEDVKKQQDWWVKHKPFIKVVNFDHHREVEFSGRLSTICKPSVIRDETEYCEVCGVYNLIGVIYSLESKKNKVNICPFCVERLFNCVSPEAEEFRKNYPDVYEEYTAKMFMKAL